MRQVEFEKRKNDWLAKLAKQDAQLVRLKTLNVELVGRLKQMNLQIDELFQQAQIKSQIDAMRDQSDNIHWEYECDHEALLERLEELI